MPTHYRGAKSDTSALNAFIKLSRANLQLTGSLAAHMAGHGLTPGQFGILETLMHLGPLAQHELGAKLLSSKPNISAVLDNLERDGLVRRERDEKDRRSQRVHLTPQGRKAISKAFPVFLAYLKDAFSALSPAELEQLGALNKKLGLSLQQKKK
jgi:MarR family 2-MHQ and catechol resistance regulon transcriptional repressor